MPDFGARHASVSVAWQMRLEPVGAHRKFVTGCTDPCAVVMATRTAMTVIDKPREFRKLTMAHVAKCDSLGERVEGLAGN